MTNPRDPEADMSASPSSDATAASETPRTDDVPAVRHAYDKPAPRSGVMPTPRAGFKTRVVPVDVNDHARLLAAVARALVGVLFIVVALHFLPIHLITPIMTGMGILMVVTGSYAAWQVGRSEPRLAKITRIVVWGAPIIAVLAIVLTTIFGPGKFSPQMTDLIR